MANIKKEFKINDKDINGKHNRFENLQVDEEIEINDGNFLEVVENNLSSINNIYLNKNGNNKTSSKINVEKKEPKVSIEKKKKKYSRRFKILRYCLNQLKYNNISIKQLMTKKSPLQSRPYQLPYSLDFINAVKYDRYEKLEKMLDFPELLYSYDYYRQTGFHWAVKLEKIKSLLMMLKCDNCINQTDINGNTPLALAAKNNSFDICQILCDSGANPLIPNNDGILPKDLATEIKLRSYLSIFTINYSNKEKY